MNDEGRLDSVPRVNFPSYELVSSDIFGFISPHYSTSRIGHMTHRARWAQLSLSISWSARTKIPRFLPSMPVEDEHG
jgi:hypothetical protein